MRLRQVHAHERWLSPVFFLNANDLRAASANSGVRQAVADYCAAHSLKAFIPERTFTTDNAAMVAIAGYYKYLDKKFCGYDEVPCARVTV